MKERWMNDKKFRRNVIIFAVILLILVCASFYTVIIKPRLSTETYVYKEETVSRGELILGIMESGSISLGESSILYDLNLDLDEDDEDEDEDDEDEENIRYLEIEEVYAVSGQRIKEGDLLFSLTSDSVTAVRRRLSSALSEAQIALSEAQTEYNISLLSAQSTYDSSVTTGNRAQSDYQAALTTSSEKVKSLEGQIKILELEITNAQEMLVDEDLLESYDAAKTQYTQAKNKYEETDLHNATAYTSNLSAFQEAESQLELLEEELQGYRDTITDNPIEIVKLQEEIEAAKSSQVIENQQAENEYNSARLEGELAKDIYSYSTDSLSDAVTVAQTDLDEIQSKMDAFEAFVGEEGKIYAKEAGLVVSVAYEAGDHLMNTGSMLTYSTEDNYTVSIDVSEEDVAAIKIGDNVDIVFTAYPEQQWIGTITSITTSATAEHASTISYPVTIQVEGDTSLLYGGMTADVTFVTDSVSDVLYVSKKAVFEENGRSYVYRQTASGKREQVEVTTGFADMSSIEITSGLAQGDIIYIQSIMNVSEESSNGTSKEDTESDGSTQESMPAMENGDFSGGFPSNAGGGQ